ncbi:MAG: alpha/beta hydrolase fold protein [Frankiales bacterium]|nr:alpha/beta hydrolase fold protein [Frankiales bacterium]
MSYMAEVTIDEREIHGNLVRFAQAGETGPVLLLVHGIASKASQWHEVMAELGGHYRVIAPDLLGHGESAKPRGDYSLGAHACGLRDLLAALGHDRVTVIGHSLGGGIAMQFAYQFPERVERLALVDAGGLGPEVSVFLRAATLPLSELVIPVITASWVRKAGRKLDETLGRTWHGVPAGTRAALEGFGSLSDPATRAAFIHTARSVMDFRGQRIDARDRLYLASDLPLLIVWGEKDPIIPVSHGRTLAEKVPTARFEVFAQSGHFPHMTEPHRLAELLHDWVSTTEPAQLDTATLTNRLRNPA